MMMASYWLGMGFPVSRGSRRSPWGLFDKDLSGVHLSEAETLEEAEGLQLVLGEVELGDLEELLLHLPHDIREEELAEPLPAIVGQHLEVEDADRGSLPAQPEALHVPDE